MEEDIKIPTVNDLKKEPIVITLPFKWGEDVWFMDNNTIHNGKMYGFSCHESLVVYL
jgi:hypothetical protein